MVRGLSVKQVINIVVGSSPALLTDDNGLITEWLKVIDLKSILRVNVTEVRILFNPNLPYLLHKMVYTLSPNRVNMSIISTFLK